jgi:23S rRNA (uracil1939-C5)-methyltransferase
MENCIEVTISALGSEGQGIGKLPSGKACFAAGAFPGERCICRIESETSKYAVCEVLEVLEASPDRVTPFRPVSEVSGDFHLPRSLTMHSSDSRRCGSETAL